MNARALASSAIAAALLWSGVALGQQPAPEERTVARLKAPTGTVLVSQRDAVVAGTKDQRLPVGTRVTTTAGAEVVIAYDNGCDVKLNENQRFTVRESNDCAALVAAVETNTAPVAAAGGRGNFGGAAALIGAGAIGAVLINRDQSSSPNAAAVSLE